MVDFLVIGPHTAIAYHILFPLIKDDVVSVGVSRLNLNSNIGVNCFWFTSLDHPGPGFLMLKKGGEYSKFDNYDAINIDKVKDIPDYKGVMGVPITFMDKYDKRQFRIVGYLNNGCRWDDKGLQGNDGVRMTFVGGEYKYLRLLIKKR